MRAKQQLFEILGASSVMPVTERVRVGPLCPLEFGLNIGTLIYHPDHTTVIMWARALRRGPRGGHLEGSQRNVKGIYKAC